MTTPLLQIKDKTNSILRMATRQSYIEVMTYLASLINDFVVNQNTVISFDSENAWPINLSRSYDNAPQYLAGLLLYKNIPISIAINNIGSVYLSFPLIILKGYKINSYVKRRWSGSSRNPDYYSPEKPQSWEVDAFKNNRVPTQEEFIKAGIATNSTKQLTATISININHTNEEIMNMVGECYKKYQSYLKKVATFNASSSKSAYKSYLKLRANGEFQRWKSANPTTEVKKELITI